MSNVDRAGATRDPQRPPMGDRFPPMRPCRWPANGSYLLALGYGLWLWLALAALRSPRLAPARAPSSEITSVNHPVETD